MKLPQDPRPVTEKKGFAKFMSIRTTIGSVVVYLWPFVAMTVCIALMVGYDKFLA